MFAATTQQTIALVVFLAAVIGAVFYLIGSSRKAKPEVGSEIELAPNRKPYYDDEQLEGPRLERALLWGVLSLMVIGVGLPLYWLVEPNRQEGAIEYFDERLASKTYHHGQPVGGGALFAATAEGGFNCAGCHGGDAGIGGQVPYTLTEPDGDLRQVQWKAPRLDIATSRWTDEQLTDILVYGRPFSPMPAWGIEGGGPMNEQQISNLVRYLHQIAREGGFETDEGTPITDAIRKVAAQEAREEKVVLLGLDDELADLEAELGAAESDADKEDVQAEIDDLWAEVDADSQFDGEALFNMNCARCHTQGWSYDEPKESGGGGMAPPLYNVDDQFPSVDDHVDFVSGGRLKGERYGETGQFDGQMPYFLNLLTEDQIAAIVEYERSLAEEFNE
jgi:mono/diheme cytochrome c family protein